MIAPIVIGAVLLILCVFCNGIVIRSFFTEKYIRSHANMYVISLSCADLGCGIVGISLFLVSSFENFTEYILIIQISFDIFWGSASIFNCVVLSIERALKVNFPYWYANNMTSLKIKVSIFFVWFAALIVASLSFARKERKAPVYLTFLFIVAFVIPVYTIFTSYLTIFYVARKHVRNIRSQNHGGNKELRNLRWLEVKVAWKTSIFTAVHILCWTPQFVTVILTILSRDNPLPLMYSSVILKYINAAINPFIYALFNPSFRKAIIKLFQKRQLMTSQRSYQRNGNLTLNTAFPSPTVSRYESGYSPQNERQVLSPLEHQGERMENLYKDNELMENVNEASNLYNTSETSL
ncbi:trace amine-associated receptor 13c-like [Xenia sp. Carnegie-2017]|uniref:trace amine-associated receptor 13c-like n=1 Tax=Xenia sp. Carnegie-2017 TaxID=2897299 RepID=UPI001F041F6F|nr:trace amine-associated receptor 13c-like [Xenia sp. Carnegie-2017]XP_046851733.1 trace amine-associated receptor 13c-like [Xenia sp. Carnegie-2017]